MSGKRFVGIVVVLVVLVGAMMLQSPDGKSIVRQVGDFINYHALLIGGLWSALRVGIDPVVTILLLLALLLSPPLVFGFLFRVVAIEGVDSALDKNLPMKQWMIWVLQLIIFLPVASWWVRFVPRLGNLNPWFEGALMGAGIYNPEIFPAFFFFLVFVLMLGGAALAGAHISKKEG